MRERPCNFIDITGKRFNRLTVTGLAYTKKWVSFWECVCDCGTKKIIRSQDIREGHTKSCGCIQKSKNLKEALERKLKWNGECLEWVGCLTDAGYGIFQHNRVKCIGAHRASYEVYKGKISDGLFVRHLCHNRKCCNPDHLELGTQQDNVDDCVKAGRQNKGSEVNTSKLSKEQVLEMRKYFSENKISYEKLGRMYSINGSSARLIILRKNWKHV